MSFKDEIKKTLFCFGEPAKLISKSKTFNGFCLFRKIVKRKEDLDLLDMPTPDEVGDVVLSTYFVWAACKEKLEPIESIICGNKEYQTLHQQFNREIGCLQLIVVERSKKWKHSKF